MNKNSCCDSFLFICFGDFEYMLKSQRKMGKRFCGCVLITRKPRKKDIYTVFQNLCSKRSLYDHLLLFHAIIKIIAFSIKILHNKIGMQSGKNRMR